ncbi:hypothetical protein BQ8794_50704 [Mesorhizobium prunaredense]|uniref:Uncharacterized protein n=1 Tax=Mesorhizobium prunaredense TaxID=1631249 RepID=A0A1R3VIB1_9HYPH|nr:hypothetical protein [Mesorhizobium prunaredense]SIT58602.1 hypothetical protein BQ8794_50704 [Mesorhizobium prunaredense]
MVEMENPFHSLSANERRNLLYHCREGGLLDAIHNVLHTTNRGSSAWFELHDRLGTLADYLQDLSLGYEILKGRPAEAWHGNFEHMSLYTLAASSIRNLSENIPIGLIAALIDTREWSSSQCLDHARSVTNKYQSPIALAVAINYVPEAETKGLITEIVDRVQRITIAVDRRFYEERPPDDPRLPVLIAVIRAMDERFVQGVIPLLKLIPRWQIDIAAAELASALPVSYLPSILRWLPEMEPWHAADLLLEVSARLQTPSVRKLAFDVALRNITSEQSCGEKQVIELLMLLGRAGRRELRTRLMAMDAKTRIQPGGLFALLRFYREITSDDLDKLRRKCVLETSETNALEFTLQVCSRDTDLGHAVEAIRQLPTSTKFGPEDAFDILKRVGTIADGAIRSNAILAAEEIAFTTLDCTWRSRAHVLVELSSAASPRQKQRLLQRALEEVPKVEDGKKRAYALRSVMPHLTEGTFESCLRIFNTLPDEDKAPAFDPQHHAKFSASATRDEPDGIVAQMVRLAGSERVEMLVDELLSIRNPANRSMALLPVLPHLSMPVKEKVATAALEASRAVNDGEERDHLIAWLRLFEPDPRNTRDDIALPFESYSSWSGKLVRNYDGAVEWLRALPERGPQRENLAKCYLRSFVRKGTFFLEGRDGKPASNHRLLELIPYLGRHAQLAVCRMLRAKLRTVPKTARPGLTAEYLEYIPPAVKAQVHNLAAARKRVSVALPSSSQLAESVGLSFRTLVREYRIMLQNVVATKDNSSDWTMRESVLRAARSAGELGQQRAFAEALCAELSKTGRLEDFPDHLRTHISMKRRKQIAVAALKQAREEYEDEYAETDEARAAEYFASAGMFDQSYKVIRAMNRENVQAKMLAVIAPHCDPSKRLSLIQEALLIIDTIDEEDDRRTPLQHIAISFGFLAENEKSTLLEFWLERLWLHSREVVLAEFRIVAALAYELCGIEAVRSALRSVKTATNWWP